ncbi:MAG: hypothetical protein ACHQNA_09495, partial [Acidimicrobiales bacterium]
MQRPLWNAFPVAMMCVAVAAFAGQASAAGTAKATAKPPAAAMGGGDAAAKIGDKTITLQEVDQLAAADLMRAKQMEYEARQRVLDGIIDDDLLELEAKAKGVTKDKLIETEINAKAPDATPAEIDAFYEQNKARMGSQTKEQASPQIGAMLKSQKMGTVRADYIKT